MISCLSTDDTMSISKHNRSVKIVNSLRKFCVETLAYPHPWQILYIAMEICAKLKLILCSQNVIFSYFCLLKVLILLNCDAVKSQIRFLQFINSCESVV